MNKIPTIKPGTYLVDLGGHRDVESVSVKTNVVPKPPPKFCMEVEIAVVPKPPPGAAAQNPGGAGQGTK